MIHLHALLPELAGRETRSMSISPPGLAGIPPGRYEFVESYCQDPDCDCRRVLINVIGEEQGRVVATISHSFEPPRRNALVREQTFLDPINPQSKWSKALLEVFLTQVLDDVYADRLVRHYEAVKRGHRGPGRPDPRADPPAAGQRLPARAGPAPPARPRPVAAPAAAQPKWK